ncbi:hypothetical protein [Flavobacterium reichenbachii]|uniref:Lipoprotein n=1 Tax=Flavobacterium reichenbachii TaxID=362418 RepID=A0A085ZDY8_9FLAO|nr:hypothetical protein [Flavobacterium reichenbachii]KFF02652.1 hypothetical protein IW19_23590 [Flavobacterium reichenbachii]OXB11147.1 hypothetical protein B0A68_21220 [Flavobacterium reichenbachii]
MIKCTFYLIVFIIFGCNHSNFYQKTEQEEIDHFFENFINLKTNVYNFKKIKYVAYGDSLALKYWIEDSQVDTTYLKKNIILQSIPKNSIANKRPAVLDTYKVFDFENFYKYKRKNPNANFNEYFTRNFNNSELMTIIFLVFNEEKDKALIYYSIGCGIVEVYSKKNNQWFLSKEISRVTM